MRPLLLPAVILFIIWLTLNINRSRGRQEKTEKAFWDREREANMTRRKSLDGLEYIDIPLESLPLDTEADDEMIADCISTIKFLSEDKIVNLTGYTNTDLKLMYGAPNINLLTRYDQAYLSLARTLHKWGALLMDKGYVNEARTVLEFAVSTGTDVTGTYSILKNIYIDAGEEDNISDLIAMAETLNSASKPGILRLLGS